MDRNFFWGAAASAHQVEGGNQNDWTEWERKSAKSKVESAKRSPPAGGWPDFILSNYPNPLQEENYISGRACDHYNRFREDFDIAKSLGHNAHRFSIEWSRIEPEEGKFNEKEIEHYREVIRALRERGLEPFVTLWHYTLPIWLSGQGGIINKNFDKIFTRYATKVASALKSDVTFWITMNEPETVARHGYLQGNRPPELKNIFKAYLALKNQFRAHKLAVHEIKKINPSASVGFSETISYFETYRNSPHNKLLMHLVRWLRNNPFLKDFIKSSDFIGVQYYFHTRVGLHWASRYWIQYNENKSVNDLGWEIYPEGIYRVLKTLKRYGKPIYITENGVADARDALRAQFIKDHIAEMKRAMDEGVDVRGYFYWSLLDNFEWDKGFWPRFGLVEIDYKTMERKIRPSAHTYKELITDSLNKLE